MCLTFIANTSYFLSHLDLRKMKRSQTTLTSFFTKKPKNNTVVEVGHCGSSVIEENIVIVASTSSGSTGRGSQEFEASSSSQPSRFPEERSQQSVSI